MTDEHDNLMRELAQLDPVSSDPAPAPGSPRSNFIKEHVMTSNQITSTTKQKATRPRTSRWLGAAAASIAAVGLTFLWVGNAPSAAAEVQAAVENSADVTDFRLTIATVGESPFPGGSAAAEVDGENVHIESGNLEYYLVDGTEWLYEDGELIGTNPVETFPAPYGESSAAVINAALQSGDVTASGTESLNGVQVERYEIGIDQAAYDALAAVSDDRLEWFAIDSDVDVEASTSEASTGEESTGEVIRVGFLEDADSITIWIADDLVHQISVNEGATQFTHTFSDFGDDITISAPE